VRILLESMPAYMVAGSSGFPLRRSRDIAFISIKMPV
jgi:hypothetical protein